MAAPPTVAALPSRALIAVHGPDWRGFLQGLITQDVETLAPGEVRFAALLTPQGRLLYDLFIVGETEGCLIDCAADHRAALSQRLKIYRLRAKVEIDDHPAPVAALWGADAAPADKALSSPPGGGGPRSGGGGSPVNASGPQLPPSRPSAVLPPGGGESALSPMHTPPAGWLADPRLPALGFRGYGAPPPADAATAAESDYDRRRLTLGVPGAADWGVDAAYPIEADFDLLAGIDFRKGCFVGQETTSRMKRRGLIKSRMAPIAFDGPPPAHGSELLAGTLRAGQALSGVDGMGMALLRLDRLEAGALTLEDGRAWRAVWPEWLRGEGLAAEYPRDPN